MHATWPTHFFTSLNLRVHISVPAMFYKATMMVLFHDQNSLYLNPFSQLFEKSKGKFHVQELVLLTKNILKICMELNSRSNPTNIWTQLLYPGAAELRPGTVGLSQQYRTHHSFWLISSCGYWDNKMGLGVKFRFSFV